MVIAIKLQEIESQTQMLTFGSKGGQVGVGRGVVVVVINCNCKLQEDTVQMQVKTFGSNGGQVAGAAVDVVVVFNTS